MGKQPHDGANVQGAARISVRRRSMIAGAAALAAGFFAQRSAQPVRAGDGDAMTIGGNGVSDGNDASRRTTMVTVGDVGGSGGGFQGGATFFQFDASWVNGTPLGQSQNI